MNNLKILRSMVLSFASGLALGNLATGIKLCIIIPLVILLFMTYDEKSFYKNKEKTRGIYQ